MSDRSLPSVVHVLWSGGVGGIERLVHDLAREQLRQGMRVGVAFGQPSEPFASAVRAAGIPVIDLAIRSGYELHPARLVRATRALRRWDVVHLHGFNLPLATVTIAARRPVVFTEHGNFALGREPGRAGNLKQSIQSIFLRRHVTAIAANSNHTAKRLAALYRIPLADVDIVWNGVDFASIPPPTTAREQGSNGLLVAYVGRLVNFKRVERLIEACARVPAGPGLEALIVGAGPLDEPLKRLARERAVDDRVRFLGNRSDLDDVLAPVDVLVHPSEGEPFGLAIVEACARGLLPVVFADGGGALEVVPPDARIVASIDELSTALEGLAASDALSLDARRARSSWARERFPIARAADGYLELYRSARAGR
jgi:glycosyltransferase involved in cell wall biosynthesis